MRLHFSFPTLVYAGIPREALLWIVTIIDVVMIVLY